MDVTTADIAQILSLLAETPQRIGVLTDNLELTQLHVSPEQDAWSVHTILAHLRACADVWGNSILAMLGEDQPTLRYVSPRTWIRKTDYLEQEFHAAFQAFAQQRADLLASLSSLASSDWSRTATFTGTVKGHDQTVFSYAQRIVDHELQHLEQIENIVSAIQLTD
ncbi:MAG: DinB family protein [Roseiflexaceae bacterium]